MNISGKWSFKEDFDLGSSSGIITLHQLGESLSAVLELTEIERDTPPLFVKQYFEGLFIDNTLVLKGISIEILNGPMDTEYVCDNLEGIINSEGKIIGSTIDLQGVCGVFVMERL